MLSPCELGIVHFWLGYSVAAVITLRLIWTLSGNPSVGLMRFYPSFIGLKLSNVFTHPSITKLFMLGIALSLLATTATGIAMDEGKTIGLANVSWVALVYADEVDDHNSRTQDDGFGEALEDTHEFLANLLLERVDLWCTYFNQPTLGARLD